LTASKLECSVPERIEFTFGYLVDLRKTAPHALYVTVLDVPTYLVFTNQSCGWRVPGTEYE